MAAFDRKKVRSSFSRKATAYELHAVVQKRVIDRVASKFGEICTSPSCILDIGSGTGMLMKRAASFYPTAKIIGLDLAFGMSLAARDNLPNSASIAFLTADAESLPFGNTSFDLVLSTSTFQWLDDLDRVFAEVFRVLTPGGRFVFTLFGDRTLFELRESYRKAWQLKGKGPEVRTHSFHYLYDVETALIRKGFIGSNVTSETDVELHRNVPELLRSLRETGAGNAAPGQGRGLGERGVMREMMDIYMRDHGSAGVLPATYEVIYGEAVKP
jgi:malonyl-CoA O-methyltransferase